MQVNLPFAGTKNEFARNSTKRSNSWSSWYTAICWTIPRMLPGHTYDYPLSRTTIRPASHPMQERRKERAFGDILKARQQLAEALNNRVSTQQNISGDMSNTWLFLPKTKGEAIWDPCNNEREEKWFKCISTEAGDQVMLLAGKQPHNKYSLWTC
jgi:hypothetical protein